MRGNIPTKQQNNSSQKNTITACPSCDLLLTVARHKKGNSFSCPRCRHLIAGHKHLCVPQTCALSLTGLLLFIPANFLPLFTFDLYGITQQGSVLSSITALYQQKFYFVAILVCFTSLIIPFFKLSLIFAASLTLQLNIHPSGSARFMRWYHQLQEWGMTEIYLIGVFITIIKMYHMAAISYNLGFFCFLALVCIIGTISILLSPHCLWDQLDQMSTSLANKKLQNSFQIIAIEQEIKKKPTTRNMTAMAAGMVTCRTCHYLFIPDDIKQIHWNCPRCDSITHMRIPNSVSKTWALLLTAIIFAFPANLLPAMKVIQFGTTKESTILDGIIYFFQDGSYGIGLIIFTASILVPLFKITGMLIVLNSIQFTRLTRLRHKTIMLRLISFIGRWSMLDIFVIALLCTVVNFGFFTNISIAPGAPFFAAVVLTTMFAATSFDSRLLWDQA